MCGIAAVAGNLSAEADASLQSILERLVHRGRPGTLYEIEKYEAYKCILGTNRLPIIDAPQGTQPKSSMCGTFNVIMNGEIFNHMEIRNSLIELALPSEITLPLGDTAILANALEAWGVKRTLETLNWEGAFVALDITNREIIAARDHLGIKPLYVSIDRGRLLLGSEIKALLGVTASMIRPIMPGTVERFSVDDLTEGSVHHWWSLPADQECFNRIEDVDDGLASVLRRAVAIRVPEEPYAVLLSGGVDSSLILKLAIEVNADATAYVLCTPNSPDLPFARELCEKLDVRLIEVPAAERSVLSQSIPDIINCVESWEWHVLNHSAPMDILFKTIRAADHKVVLTGEGADELFCGYNNWDPNASMADLESERAQRIRDLHRTNCRRLDRMGMRHGLECRVPFLDKEMVSLALQINAGMCLSQETNKIPLRRVASRFLPANIATRKKLSLAKGAGYSYQVDDYARSGALEAADVPNIAENSAESALPRFDVERSFLKKFIREGFDRAPYLLSRSI